MMGAIEVASKIEPSQAGADNRALDLRFMLISDLRLLFLGGINPDIESTGLN
jgi:hypothetical protein